MLPIFVAYTKIHPYTLLALEGYEWTGVQMETDGDYPDFFAERWKVGESFINIEHDISFAHGLLEEMSECSAPWCGVGYHPGGTGSAPQDLVAQGGAAIGVAKFSADFIAATPMMFAPPYLPKKHWGHCDGWINDTATAAGFLPHQHWPDIVNMHPCPTCRLCYSPYVDPKDFIEQEIAPWT